MKECFKVGLYRQGLLHDLSKYSPTEFLVGCRYYQGNRSPNNAEREATGYSKAWLHHKGRNKHHYEYWIDYSVDPGEGIIGLKMPLQYVVEMFMDRIAASKTYQGDAYRDSHPLEYYEKGAGAAWKNDPSGYSRPSARIVENAGRRGRGKKLSGILRESF